MERRIFKPRYYQHIDKIIDTKDIVSKVKSKEYIKHHSFYPFISYTINFKKYSETIDTDTNHHWKLKKRPIKYASHIDRCIYQWYSFNINNMYNKYCINMKLNNNSVAYRTNLRGMTNIEFSKIAFDFIKKCKECYVLVSDFTSFFDSIDHDILKKNLCKILNVDKLDEDIYKVYKSMTKYAYIEKDVIIKFLIENQIETIDSIKLNNSLFDKIKWREAKKHLKDEIKTNEENFGIPQGSPLSGIFANVYMIDFDQSVNDYVKKKNGMYMRYSDDLIIIVPKNQVESINELWISLNKIKSNYSTLLMNVSKTSGYIYENCNIKSLHEIIPGMKNGNNSINYLGFSFDGSYIKFRDKTLTKFFYKLYRKIDNMLKRENDRIIKGKKKKTKIDKHMILKELNISSDDSRKFIDYVYRAKRVYKGEKYISNFSKEVKNKIFLRFERHIRYGEKNNLHNRRYS